MVPPAPAPSDDNDVPVAGLLGEVRLGDGAATKTKILTKVNAWKDGKFAVTLSIPVDGNYVDDPLGCELRLREKLDEALAPWRRDDRLDVPPPSFSYNQEEMANNVARRRDPPDKESFLSTARLLLLGDKDSLWAVCENRRAATRAALGDASSPRGQLTRKAAARLSDQGDAFHFLAAVPVDALADLLRAQVIEKNKRGKELSSEAQGARLRMIDCILESGVELDRSFDIELHGGAFPGTLDPRTKYVNPAKVPSVRWLRAAGNDGPVLEGFRTRSEGEHVIPGDLYVLVGGYDDSDHPKRKLRKRRYELTFPGGKRILGESGLTCALREVQEETLLALRPENNICEYPEARAGLTEVNNVRFHYDFGPYHIVASVVADANDDHPDLPAWPGRGDGGKGGRGDGGKGRGRGRGKGRGRGRGNGGRGRGA